MLILGLPGGPELVIVFILFGLPLILLLYILWTLFNWFRNSSE